MVVPFACDPLAGLSFAHETVLVDDIGRGAETLRDEIC
jgi:hypothetical protein